MGKSHVGSPPLVLMIESGLATNRSARIGQLCRESSQVADACGYTLAGSAGSSVAPSFFTSLVLVCMPWRFIWERLLPAVRRAGACLWRVAPCTSMAHISRLSRSFHRITDRLAEDELQSCHDHPVPLAAARFS